MNGCLALKLGADSAGGRRDSPIDLESEDCTCLFLGKPRALRIVEPKAFWKLSHGRVYEVRHPQRELHFQAA